MKEYEINRQSWDESRTTKMFSSSNEFSLYIEKMASDHKLTYVEAVLAFCEEHMIEPSDITTKINQSLREKLEQDFRDLNFLPKKAQLEDV
jgi:cell division ATPase FtsA